ncbi:MAG: PAS domain S-box protein [Candidatus Acidiferrum sp.]|jgi:PAS domain S-box-containing protein
MQIDSQEILRKSAALERALRASDERFHAVVNNMAEGLYTVDTQGMLTYVNPSAEAMFGWKLSELHGRKMHDVTHYRYPDGRPFPAAECPGLQVLQSGISLREHEDVFIRKDGSFFPVVYSASPLKIDDQTAGIVVCFRDDTVRRQAQANIEQTERQLRHSLQTLEVRVSERTRELESATTMLRELSARLLQTQDEERRRIARELHDGVGQLLVALSMSFSKFGREENNLTPIGRQTLEENSAIVAQALQDIRTMSHLLHPPLLDDMGLESALHWYIEGFAERSKIQVELQLPTGFNEGLPRDLALSIFRIVQESLTNIHRHSGSPTALVAVERIPEQIILRIKDQGRGIPADLHARICSGQSSGVGLRGIRERLRHFGGRLYIPQEQKGTEIVAILPTVSSTGTKEETIEGHEAGRAAESPTSQMGAATILCIDDEAVGQLARRLLLESAGYRVVEARSGEEGLRAFQSSKIDAVVLDYWMSGLKGTAVASELKRLDPDMPIIVLSGMADLPGESGGLVDEWLMKGSHRPEHLLNSINAMLQRRAQK